MNEFHKWLLNIGYTEKEIIGLSREHLEILKDEYLGLLFDRNIQ